MCWGFIHGIPAILFFHYCITSGRSFRWNCNIMRVLGLVAALASFVFAFLSLPAEVDLSPALAKGLGFISAQRADGVQVGSRGLLHGWHRWRWRRAERWLASKRGPSGNGCG